jgi:hypothetical protein
LGWGAGLITLDVRMRDSPGQPTKTFHVLVLKTNMKIPYMSVFIRLECGYWSAEAEKRLREKMAQHLGDSGIGTPDEKAGSRTRCPAAAQF